MPAIARVVGFCPGWACSDWVSSRSTSARAGSPLGRNMTNRMLSELPTIFGLSIEPHLNVTNGGAEPPPPPPPDSIIFSSFMASSLMDAFAPCSEASRRSWTRIVQGMPPPNSGFGVSVPVTGLIVQTFVLVIEYSCGLKAHWIGSCPSITSWARSKFCGIGIGSAHLQPGVGDLEGLHRHPGRVGANAGAGPADGEGVGERPGAGRLAVLGLQLDRDLLELRLLAGLPEPLLQGVVVGHAARQGEVGVADTAGEVVDELVVAALGPLEDVELHRQPRALAERADVDPGDADLEVVIAEDGALGHGSEKGVDAVEGAEVLVLLAEGAQHRVDHGVRARGVAAAARAGG